MNWLRRSFPDLLVLAVLLLLPLLIFWPVAVGDRTLVPAENIYQWAPWNRLSETHQAIAPHNELLSDLLLQNHAWKRFLLQSVRERQIPLWNPYLFAGTPFLAAGQHSGLYPFSLIFLFVPLERAYGVFTVSQLFLAGAFAYLLGRVLGIGRGGASLAAVTYQLCGYTLVSVAHPMILAASAWLPFLLAMTELVIRQQRFLGGRPATLPWAALGAVGLGIQMLAGHGENTYFTLLVMGFYAAWRLGSSVLSQRAKEPGSEPTPAVHRLRPLLRPSLWLIIMVLFGMGLGAVQFIPLAELVQHNFREGTASLADVLDWSFPPRRIITFVAPNFFGNPSHHSYFDLFAWRDTPVTVNAFGDPISKIDWGMKNYVEGGAYLGILPLLLAATAVLHSLSRSGGRKQHRRDAQQSVWFFALLALASLTFIFPTGTYAIIHSLPIISQSHAPFRWVYPLSLSVAVLAGWGVDALVQRDNEKRPSIASILGTLSLGSGLAGIAGLFLSRLFYDRVEPVVERAFLELAGAPEAFPDARAFYSYEFRQLLIAALMLLAAGLMLRLARRRPIIMGQPFWTPLAVGLVALDLAAATWGFTPAADPALLPERVKPALIQFLKDRPGEWRLTTFTPQGDKPLNANTPWLYDLQDARGYDSIISRQYVDYMEAIEPQGELLYNRIQPIVNWESLNSPLLDLLNVKYVISAEEIALPKFRPVWAGEGLRVYENLGVAPRAFTLPQAATVVTDDPLAAMRQYDPRSFVIVESGSANAPSPGLLIPATVSDYGTQEILINAQPAEPSWLVLVDSYSPGWKAFVRTAACEDCDETELQIHRVDGNFRGVQLSPGEWQVRFKYSPMSFKVGLFVSFVAAMTIVFTAGVWVWRRAYREGDADSAIRRVAKNSLAPMALNLFNRGIDFAFAALMLRILGAEHAGRYYVAINIALWYEILANFGLNTLLMREVSRKRDDANRYLVNTTILRTFTGLGAAIPIAVYVLLLGTGPEPLGTDTTLAILLLIVGMIPGGINTGLTALFYAYEKAEIPAACTTIATFLKVSLGAVALLLGTGFVGLAAVSILVNLVTMLLLGTLAVRAFFVPRWEFDGQLQRKMVGESFPLMLNHLLQTLFFRVDVLLLERLGGKVIQASGNTVVGWYSTSYKWIDALNIIPAFFTFAVFPVLSRQAEESTESILRTYRLAVKLLVMISLPLAVITGGLAPTLIRLLGGSEYLPHGAIALQLMIWSIPIGWINSITNYVLIALGRQRMLTRAFVIGLTFNLGANLLLLPAYDYPATAVIAVFSELVLAVAFYHYIRPVLGPIRWAAMLWRPVAAAGAMAAVSLALSQAHWTVGMAIGIVVYCGALALLRYLSPAELELLASILPTRASKPESDDRPRKALASLNQY